MSDSTSPAPPSVMRMRVSVSGTCFTQTAIFIAASWHAPHQQRAVRAAKAERVRERVFDSRLARLVGNTVEIAFGVLVLQVDRRRQDLVTDHQRGDAGLESACRAEQMPGHRLGGAD